jgi:Cdc6-like AAA superfamily ATPase
MLKHLINEFNCNHEAHFSEKAEDMNVIYNREKEHSAISEFLCQNHAQKKSGLMYLCGHPGTGKTSSLNFVMQDLANSGQYRFKPVVFNAMTFFDVKGFCVALHQRLHEEFFG